MATTDANDLEHNWDVSQSQLRAIDKTSWTRIDGTIDNVLTTVRSGSNDIAKCDIALGESLDLLQSING